MNSITYVKKDNEKITFTEGQTFELNGVIFRIVTIKEKGKMVIKPAL